MPITSKIITITPNDALTNLTKMVHNRPLSQASVKKYADEIKSGNWGLNGQGIIFDAQGRLLDGQHRMHAIIKSGKSIQTLAVYGVSDEMFSRMDIGNKRSVSDVINVKNRFAVASAAKFLFREMRTGNWWNNHVVFHPINGVEVMQEHPGIEDSVAAMSSMKGIKKLITPSISGYCHYRAGMQNKAMRDKFFQSLNTGADLGFASPILALRNALVPVPGSRRTDQNVISLFIVAWDKYIDGEPSKFIKLPKNVPFWTAAL